MSSRIGIQQIVSTTQPVGAAVGDEWFNPSTGKLYKNIALGGTQVGFIEVPVLSQSVNITNATNATSTFTGALTVAGGAGVQGNLYVGGTIYGTISGSISSASNLAGGTAGQLAYQSAPGTTAFAGPGSYGQFLMSNGANAPLYQSTLTQSNGNIVITSNAQATSTSSGALQIINGGVGVGGNIWVGGGVTLADNNGTNSSNLAINSFFPTFNIKTLNPNYAYGANALITHSDSAGTVWTMGSIAQGGPVNSTSTLYINVFKPSGYGYPYASGDTVFAGNGSPNLRISFSGTTTIYNTSTSVSTTTGALQVAGGVGVGGGMYVGSTVTATQFATVGGNGTILSSGLLSRNGGDVSIAAGGNSTPSAGGYPGITAQNNGALELYGGNGVSFPGHINLRTANPFSTIVYSTSATVSTSSGALQVVNGGVGIGGSVYVGNRVGFVNASNVSAVYQVYNSSANSLDTIFG